MEVKYAGFWIRVLASLIDTVWLGLLMYIPLWLAITAGLDKDSVAYSSIFVGFQYIIPALLVIFLWVKYQGTPGKRLLKLKVVDAKTGEATSPEKYLLRYVGYFVSMIPLFIGYFMVGFDKKKQGLHDKMAGTVVICEG